MAIEPNSKSELKDAILNGSFPIKVSELAFDKLAEVGTLIAELHNERSLNVVAYFETLSWSTLSNRDTMRMAYILEAFVEVVLDTSEQLWSFFHAMRSRVSDNHAYQIEKGFEVWAAANPTQIHEMVALIKNGDQDSPFLGTLLHALRKAEPNDALNAAIAFSSDERPAIRRHAILALGAVIYADEQKVVLVEARLIELLSSEIDQDRRIAIAAINQVLAKQDEKSERLVDELAQIIVCPTAEIRDELIAGLVHHGDAYPDELRKKVFELMKTVQIDCGDTLNLIDLVLYKMDIEVERDAVFEVVTAILTQESGAPSLDVFDAFTHKLEASLPEVVGWYVTQWLLSGKYEICAQLTSMFPPLDKSIYDFNLDEFCLSNAEIIYLARKIYAYFMFAHGPAVSLLCACLMALPLKERQKLETDIASFWLRNYPGDLNLFKSYCQNYPRKGLKAAIDRIQRQLNAYEKPLRSLPYNSALRPSTVERRIQAEIAHERNKEINRAANEMSVFASLVHKSTLLYGRSSVAYVYPGDDAEPIRQVIPLHSYETSSELPRMDVLYPTRLAYLLNCFRQERRPG